MRQRYLPLPEFVALMAMHFAVVAFSIDSMLPALPDIAADLSPDKVNNAQLILSSFVLGLGVGTLFSGPLADGFGRKRIIGAGMLLFIFGAVLAYMSQTLETIIVARIIQGLGASAPRVVALAIVRDLYHGRRMASIMSWCGLVFTLVPAIAPLMGAAIIASFGWRSIFVAFILFASIVLCWLTLRQSETLSPSDRRPIKLLTLIDALRECAANRVFVAATSAQILSYGVIFACLSSAQQLFDTTYGRGAEFPLWFAGIALVAGTASILNARLVIRLGMRRMALSGFLGQGILAASVVISLLSTGAAPFALFLIWVISMFFMAGLAIGNLNALAMEPFGHIAGLAASLIGFIATVLGVALAIPLGLAFDGTPLPLAMGTLTFSIIAVGVIKYALR